MSEWDEIADSLRHNPAFASCVLLDDFRQVVRALLPDESVQVVDNVASSVRFNLLGGGKL